MAAKRTLSWASIRRRHQYEQAYSRVTDDDDNRVEDLLDLGKDIAWLVLGELLENQDSSILARIGWLR